MDARSQGPRCPCSLPVVLMVPCSLHIALVLVDAARWRHGLKLLAGVCSCRRQALPDRTVVQSRRREAAPWRNSISQLHPLAPLPESTLRWRSASDRPGTVGSRRRPPDLAARHGPIHPRLVAPPSASPATSSSRYIASASSRGGRLSAACLLVACVGCKGAEAQRAIPASGQPSRLTAAARCPITLRSVRIRSTTLDRLLHGLDLLPSGIPDAGSGNAMT